MLTFRRSEIAPTCAFSANPRIVCHAGEAEIAPFAPIRPGRAEWNESDSNRSFVRDSGRYHRIKAIPRPRPRYIDARSLSRPRFLPWSVCGGCTSGLVACGEGCTRMFHGASGLGVARGRNKKGTGVPGTLRRCVLVTLASYISIDVCMERSRTRAAVGTGVSPNASTGMLTSHGEKFARSSGTPNEKYSCVLFLSFLFLSPRQLQHQRRRERGRIPAK